MMFLLAGVLGLLVKSYRIIYLLISLEMLILGAVVYNIVLLREVNYLLVLIFRVSSSVIGLIILVVSLCQYGREFVKF